MQYCKLWDTAKPGSIGTIVAGRAFGIKSWVGTFGSLIERRESYSKQPAAAAAFSVAAARAWNSLLLTFDISKGD